MAVRDEVRVAGAVDHVVPPLPKRLAILTAWGGGQPDEVRVWVRVEDARIALRAAPVRLVDEYDLRFGLTATPESLDAGHLDRLRRIRTLVLRSDDADAQDAKASECGDRLINQLKP